jgi:hypothetical protein
VNRVLTTPNISRTASRSVDGSGTGAGLSLPTDFPTARTARPSPAIIAVLKLAELVSGASNGPLGVSESAKAIPFGWPRGLPLASLAAIVTRPGLPAALL